MNVRKSSTIDDVETLKKQLADAQVKQQIFEERGHFHPEKEIIEHVKRYKMEMDGKQPDSYSNNSSSTDTVSENTNDNYSEESLSTDWDERRKERVQKNKNLQTIIIPKRVIINNYTATDAQEPV